MDKYSSELFQENLKRLREFSNLTQGELADGLFVARSSVSNYETGSREPTLSRLQQIADYFGVSVSYLIGDGNIDEDITEINDKKFNISKYVSKEGLLNISELSTIHRVVLVELMQFLLVKQRKRNRIKDKLKNKKK